MFHAMFAIGQTEDDFLPKVTLLAVDSGEAAAQTFCRRVVEAVPGYHPAIEDRENILMSTYLYDNDNFETLKFEYQFVIREEELPDGRVAKKRVVQMQKVVGEINALTAAYNFIFNTNHTPDKIMAISRYEKTVSYNGTPYTSTLVSDDYKPGYWILTFYRL